ncbi:hypothetical protein AB0I72_26365 [Nocardiopsis sp. NPDC049922]|uniref:hypothetical protein n=1 Tax=Nocardiopsis sp. NPDC049922 TaxID=3155157 RepID=UPI0033EDCD1F
MTGQQTIPTSDTLVVPVEVAALAVNDGLRVGGGFYRAATNYRSVLDGSRGADPDPFTNDTDWAHKPEANGVYLQWQLPEALTRGRQGPDGEIGDFPLVPQRWLVVRYRYASRRVRAWMVHSDFVDDWDGTVSFVDPHAQEPRATKIGRRVELVKGAPWSEPDDGRAPFLTAVGPGLLAFSVYQPFNENVFSLHDPLEDVEDDERLGYLVAGWYADPGSDILADDGTDYAALLESLEWRAPSGAGERRRSLFTGTVLGVDWKRLGVIGDDPIPDRCDIAVAVGNSTAEAEGALQRHADGETAMSAEDADLFRAFLLDTLDEMDRPEADIILRRAAHRSGFGRGPGGYVWQVVDRADASAPPPEPADARARRLATEHTVVGELNRVQAEHDRLERELAAARDRLYRLWYMDRLNTHEDKPAEFTDHIAAQLDPDDPDGAAGTVARLAGELAVLRADGLPWAMEPDDLAASARAYADARGIGEHRTLVRVPDTEFDHSADPVVLLQGARLHAPLGRDAFLPCRTPDQTITEVTDGERTTDAAGVRDEVAQIELTGLPAALDPLAAEFLVLERARARGMSLADHEGTLPEYGTGDWTQAWQPLALHWSVRYFHTPFQEDGQDRWEFDADTLRYHWKGGDRESGYREITGKQYLMPSAGADLSGRIGAYAKDRDDLDPGLVRGLRRRATELDVLSQRLDGFSARLGQRLSGGHVCATGATGALIGDGQRLAPDPGDLPGRFDPWPDSEFVDLRAGQILFSSLTVVDRFGRAVRLVPDDDPAHFMPDAVPDAMVPEHPVGEFGADRYVELGPRLLQPARLHFDLLIPGSDDPVAYDPSRNPVCGWLLHNRLDASLACYAPEGEALGELRTVLDPDSGNQVVAWRRLPGSDLHTLDDLREAHPYLHHVLEPVVRKGPDTLTALLATVDEALAGIDPGGAEPGGAGFFLGRPLALVRARLDMQLEGPPRADTGWREAIGPPAPATTGYRWIVRLGEARQTDDGLVGYALDQDYEHLETVVPPEGPANDYLRPIGNGDRLRLRLDHEDSAEVMLLLDPRAPVHAVSDVLPVGKLRVPERFVSPALEHMSVSFRTGPVLAATRTRQVEGERVTSVVMPRPATVTGRWSWTEPVGEGWETHAVDTPDPARPPVAPPHLRSGFLVLDDAAAAHGTGR